MHCAAADQTKCDFSYWHHPEVRASPSHVGLAVLTGSCQTLGPLRS